jgi:hypothetical protein
MIVGRSGGERVRSIKGDARGKDVMARFGHEASYFPAGRMI